MTHFHRLADPAPLAPVGRMLQFDGLRGLLAVYVMLGHAAPMVPWPHRVGRIVEAVVSHGFAAVNLFFALSGLVIVQSLARFESRALPFLAARAKRILPVYILVLAAAIGVLHLGSPFPLMPWLAAGDAAHQIWEARLPHPLWAHLTAHLTLMQGMMPRRLLSDAAFSLLGPAWSLSAEVQFYLLVALLARWAPLNRRGSAQLAVVFVLLAALAGVYRATAPEAWQFSRAFLPNAAIYFALGIASVPVLHHDRDWGRFTLIVLIGMLLGAVSGNMMRALTPLIWASCILVQKRPDLPALRPFACLLTSPVMLWLGLISYPLYLVNEPVQRALAFVVLGIAGPDARLFGMIWTPLALTAPVAVAAALHRTVERKFMAPRRRPDAGAGARAFSTVKEA